MQIQHDTSAVFFEKQDLLFSQMCCSWMQIIDVNMDQHGSDIQPYLEYQYISSVFTLPWNLPGESECRATSH